jgi:hypothetical protein
MKIIESEVQALQDGKVGKIFADGSRNAVMGQVQRLQVD